MSLDQPQGGVFLILVLLAVAGPASAQTQSKPRADADQLGMTCLQILKMSSTEWIAYFARTTKTDPSSGTVRAAAAYGACYQARTEDLVRTLARRGKGPSKAGYTDFNAFEAALENFTEKALVDAEPPASREKQALAALFQYQFRYEFYRAYEAKSTKGPNAAKAPPSGSPPVLAEKNVAPAPGNSSLSPPPNDTDDMTRAKNRFGELLGALPDDKLHELHGAFGEVLGLHALDEAMRLAVYRYAIFLLEPGGEDSSYPPPF
jgi:hypothetical protein